MITLQSIKAKQDEISSMISNFEKQSLEVEYLFPETQISLKPGEHYAGIILGKDGESSYHLILLPEDKDDISWDSALTWAKEAGGDLPNRREQALLYANLKEHFQAAWYWSNTQRASISVCAWCQYFLNGHQDDYYKRSKLRARAVRRLLVIQ